MVHKANHPALPPARQRWEQFEHLCGTKVRASDASWASGLSPAERLAVVDDLLGTIRAARIAAGDWQQVDDRAWRETLSDRIRQVEAFKRFDEANRGTRPVADAG
jgi:hypothetical protein